MTIDIVVVYPSKHFVVDRKKKKPPRLTIKTFLLANLIMQHSAVTIIMHWTFYTAFVSAILNAYLAIVSPELRLSYAGVCLGCTYLAYNAFAHDQREKNASVGSCSKLIELLGLIDVVQEMGKVHRAG